MSSTRLKALANNRIIVVVCVEPTPLVAGCIRTFERPMRRLPLWEDADVFRGIFGSLCSLAPLSSIVVSYYNTQLYSHRSISAGRGLLILPHLHLRVFSSASSVLPTN